MTSSILALREYLIAERVTCVVIESTAAYWKPFYFLLDDALEVMLVNARAARNVPGRKTDLSPMRPGWPIWVLMGWSVPRSCRRNRSGCCAI
jgi:hypothetical protein